MEKRQDSRPILGVTLGDVNGIGPEVAVKTLTDSQVFHGCRPVVLGDGLALTRTVRDVKADLVLKRLSDPSRSEGLPGQIEFLELGGLKPEDLAPGRPTAAGARAAARFIETGARLALEGATQGLVTGPISKEVMKESGFSFPGHTEFLAHLAGGARVAMMLAGPRLRVVLVTIHVALRDVPDLLTSDLILEKTLLADHDLRARFGLERPRLAVAGLNPHAGEAGMFGREEETVIRPAVDMARARGIDLTGPYPADSLYFRASNGEFDAVISLYHDQGLIPLKLLHFQDGVNVTLGLPFIRTSVDHGTAYDLAGQNKADPSSMKAALAMAADMAVRSTHTKSFNPKGKDQAGS